MQKLFSWQGRVFIWESGLKPSFSYPLLSVLLFVGLVVSAFALPVGYTFDKTCRGCNGIKTVACETCHGSGICWICDGTGKIPYMPPESSWCAACQGTGRCYTCGGAGSHSCEECGGRGILTHWMFTQAGSAIVFSIGSVLLFLIFFGLSYVVSAFYLGFNEWVYGVQDMGFWFNPSFLTWLFARHRKRWAKWQTSLNAIAAIHFGTIVLWLSSLNHITQESLVVGFLSSILVLSAFSFFFYKSWPERQVSNS